MSFAGLAAIGFWTANEFSSKSSDRHYQPYDGSQALKELGNEAGYKGHVEFFHMVKANAYTGIVSTGDIDQAMRQANASKARSKNENGIDWESIGPNNIGGRIRAFVIDKDDNNILYTAGVSGGFFKSENKGRSWRRIMYDGEFDNLNIVSMTQTADGTLYYGTGEQSFGTGDGTDRFTPVFIGRGVWKSTDKGETWEHLSSTEPSSLFGGSERWHNVNRMASFKEGEYTNRVFAATYGGLLYSEDGGETWNTVTGVGATNVTDVVTSPDNRTVFAVEQNTSMNSARIYRSQDGGSTFEQVSGQNAPSFENDIRPAVGRITLAIAPSNPDYVYASVSGTDQRLVGIFQSKSGGDPESWEVIGQGGGSFDPFAYGPTGPAQGNWDNHIAVDPFDEERIFVGGIHFWRWTAQGGWRRVAGSQQFLDTDRLFRNPNYVHVDLHYIAFDEKSDPPLMYVMSDGAVTVSNDYQRTNPTYSLRNQNLVTTQFYGVAMSQHETVVGGTQDNGNIRVDLGSLTGQSGVRVLSGDGFQAEISRFNPDIFIMESQFGNVRRSANQGATVSPFISDFVESQHSEGPGGGQGFAGFNAPMALWQTFEDTSAYKFDTIIIDIFDTTLAGTPISATSRYGHDISIETERDLFEGDSVVIVDRSSEMYVIGTRRGVYLTCDATNFSEPNPVWYEVARINAGVHYTEFSADGNTLFFSTNNNRLFRLTGLRGAFFGYEESEDFNPDAEGLELTEIFSINGQLITGISSDKNDDNRLLITLGNYGNQNYVFLSENAMDESPTFQSIQGSGQGALPNFPVYDGIISANDPNHFVLATELGIWSSEDGGQSWYEDNRNMEKVPVLRVRQVMPNPGQEWWGGPKLVIGTHGRGIYTSNSFAPALASSVEEELEQPKPDFKLFPNPAQEVATARFDIPENINNASLQIFNLQGKLVEKKDFNQIVKGQFDYEVNVNSYKSGMYIVRFASPDFVKVQRLIVQ